MSNYLTQHRKSRSRLYKDFIVAFPRLLLCSFSHLVSTRAVWNRRDQAALIIQLRNTRDTVGNKLNMITKTVLPPHADPIDGATRVWERARPTEERESVRQQL